MSLLRPRLPSAVVLAMPLALGLVMAGPGMVTRAAGCSGAGPEHPEDPVLDGLGL